jgi:hypothetical protein
MYVCIHMRLVQLSSKVSILWGHVACAQPTLTHQLELYNPSGALFHRKVWLPEGAKGFTAMVGSLRYMRNIPFQAIL